MKAKPTFFSLICLLLLLFGCVTSNDPVSQLNYKVITFNIRVDGEQDENSWSLRKESVAALINKYQPILFGTQEGLVNQVKYLDEALTDYSYVGVGRDNGNEAGEYCAIFYDNTKFQVRNHATFWLSATPNIPSIGWDAGYKRICTYALLEDKSSQQRFWIFNAHLDNIGSLARKNSAILILNKIAEVNTESLPVIFMGDFNSIKSQDPIQSILTKLLDSQSISNESHKGPLESYNGFDVNNTLKYKIDFVFVSLFKVKTHQHINDMRSTNLFISDHYPVMVELYR